MSTKPAGDPQAAAGSERTTGSSILRVDGLRKSFGGITAVDGATFGVEEGSLTGLIGPNGAGKSTTFDLVTGFHSADDGRVLLRGEDVTGLRPYQMVAHGLVRTFQTPRELSQMTVEENLTIAPQGQRGERFLQSVLPGLRRRVVDEEAAVLDRAREVLELFEIDHLADERATSLSGGQRKLLALARALMTEPDVLLLDEPFAGVNPTLQASLLEHLHDLREQGYTVLLIEHDMDVIMSNCEHVIVMHQGSVLTEGPPSAIQDDEQVIEAYLGGTV